MRRLRITRGLTEQEKVHVQLRYCAEPANSQASDREHRLRQISVPNKVPVGVCTISLLQDFL